MNTIPKAANWSGPMIGLKEPTRPEAFPEDLWSFTDMQDRLLADKTIKVTQLTMLKKLLVSSAEIGR